MLCALKKSRRLCWLGHVQRLAPVRNATQLLQAEANSDVKVRVVGGRGGGDNVEKVLLYVENE